MNKRLSARRHEKVSSSGEANVSPPPPQDAVSLGGDPIWRSRTSPAGPSSCCCRRQHQKVPQWIHLCRGRPPFTSRLRQAPGWVSGALLRNRHPQLHSPRVTPRVAQILNISINKTGKGNTLNLKIKPYQISLNELGFESRVFFHKYTKRKK